MNMKQKAGPAAIVAGVVIVLIVVYAISRMAFAPQSPPADKSYMPEYAKQRAVKPGEEGTVGGQPGAAPSYGQRPGGPGSGTPGQ